VLKDVRWLSVLAIALTAATAFGLEARVAARSDAQTLSVSSLELHDVKAESLAYKGRSGIHLTAGGETSETSDPATGLAIVRGSSLENGTIEVALAGDTLPTADPTARGFVGIAFRVSADRARYECFYLRPKNGRADDQLRRNHTAQYISVPGFPWEKLRQETPGKYESYVDLVPGEWARFKIRVNGARADLFVNGNDQPTLIVTDLKQTPASGAVALWVGPGTDAHFADLQITAKH
jgi:hypothetical protein